MTSIDYLSAQDILLIHSRIVEQTGGSDGVRDPHTVATLEGLPQQEAYGKELYSSVYTKAAVYMRNIITAHPFIDGNKRTGVAAAENFLVRNGYKINAPQGEIERFVLSVIAERLPLEAIAEWLEKNSKKVS